MNVFTNLLFPQDPNPQSRPFDEDDDRFATGYGNRVASARFFARLGHAKSVPADKAEPLPLDAGLAMGGCR
jgi:hypothetical protein